MRRKRVTGRFYVFLFLLLVGCYFILREVLPEGVREALVQSGSANFSQTVQAVIVRDEIVSSYEGMGRVVYIAGEGDMVKQGQEVCEVYPAGYSEKEMERLETVRQSIRSYHSQLLDNIVDTELERLESKVQSTAVEMKKLIREKSGGSLQGLERQLEEAMTQRQDYLRQNQRQDYRLNDLYDQETKRMNAISSWRTSAVAPSDGLVSFYLDGYEQYLTPASLETLTPDQVRTVLAGRSLAQGNESRLMTNIFKVVSADKWYIILLSDDINWNPSSDQDYTFQMEGFADVAYTGKVFSIQKSASEVMVVLEIQGDPGPLANVRSGRAGIGAFLSGLTVPVGAIVTQSGQTGVLLQDAAGSTFVAAEVLSQDGRNALIQPLVDGSLMVGQRVLVR